MSKNLMIALVLVLIPGLLSACALGGEEATPTPAVSSAVQQPRVVSAEAFVVPVQEAELAFEASGRITSLEVQEGDEVNEGDILARLDDATQQAALSQAQAALTEAEARLAQEETRLAEAVSR